MQPGFSGGSLSSCASLASSYLESRCVFEADHWRDMAAVNNISQCKTGDLLCFFCFMCPAGTSRCSCTIRALRPRKEMTRWCRWDGTGVSITVYSKGGIDARAALLPARPLAQRTVQFRRDVNASNGSRPSIEQFTECRLSKSWGRPVVLVHRARGCGCGQRWRGREGGSHANWPVDSWLSHYDVGGAPRAGNWPPPHRRSGTLRIEGRKPRCLGVQSATKNQNHSKN